MFNYDITPQIFCELFFVSTLYDFAVWVDGMSTVFMKQRVYESIVSVIWTFYLLL